MKSCPPNFSDNESQLFRFQLLFFPSVKTKPTELQLDYQQFDGLISYVNKYYSSKEKSYNQLGLNIYKLA